MRGGGGEGGRERERERGRGRGVMAGKKMSGGSTVRILRSHVPVFFRHCELQGYQQNFSETHH